MKRVRETDQNNIAEQFKKVWDNFEEYCTHSNFDNYKLRLKPMVDDCIEKVKFFEVENNKSVSTQYL